MNSVLPDHGAISSRCTCCAATGEVHKVLIRDVATVEGVRDNSLIGYGLVVGLKGTGDRQQTYFTVQTLASILARMGVQIPTASVRVNNVAAVFVTANLPPFSRPGMHLDVMVSSSGDARSLEGGLLLLTPLYAADGQVFAAAQGPLVVGGYTTGHGDEFPSAQPSDCGTRARRSADRARQLRRSELDWIGCPCC